MFHVLGLKWNHGSDSHFVSRENKLELHTSVTQQTLLSFVSSVFDRIGSVTPYTIGARLFLKDIWRITGRQRDDPEPEALGKQFI